MPLPAISACNLLAEPVNRGGQLNRRRVVNCSRDGEVRGDPLKVVDSVAAKRFKRDVAATVPHAGSREVGKTGRPK